MRAEKGNKVYTIDETQKAQYVKDGFDVFGDDGKLLESGAGKKVTYGEYKALADENAKLKKQLKTAQKMMEDSGQQKRTNEEPEKQPKE